MGGHGPGGRADVCRRDIRQRERGDRAALREHDVHTADRGGDCGTGGAEGAENSDQQTDPGAVHFRKYGACTCGADDYSAALRSVLLLCDAESGFQSGDGARDHPAAGSAPAVAIAGRTAGAGSDTAGAGTDAAADATAGRTAGAGSDTTAAAVAVTGRTAGAGTDTTDAAVAVTGRTAGAGTDTTGTTDAAVAPGSGQG